MNVFKRTLGGGAVLAALALSLTTVTAPVAAAPAAPLPHFVQVETSYYFSAALTADGDVYTWGNGYDGQLGLGAGHVGAAYPTRVDFPGLPTGDRIVELALGGEHVLARAESGELWAWGDSAYGQLGIAGITLDAWTPEPIGMGGHLAAGEEVVAIAAGSSHSLAVTDAGRVFGWGDNTWGQAVYTSTAPTIETPQLFAAVGSIFAAAGVRPTLLAASGASSYAAGADGSAFAWGYNGNGRLGIGTASFGPGVGSINLGPAPRADVIALDAGYAHGIAALADGSVWAWGDLETQANTPVRVTGIPATSPVAAVAAGDDVSYVLLADGRLYSWGGNGPNGEGALGIGASGDVRAGAPTEVTSWPAVRGGARITDIAAGNYYTAGAVSETGGVYMWGDYWARGDGAWDAATSPVNISLGSVPAGTVSYESMPPLLGETATAVADGWPSNATLSYRWDIGGVHAVTAPSYQPTIGEGLPLTVTVTATAENWSPTTITSDGGILGTRPVIGTIALPDAEAGQSYLELLWVTGSTPIVVELVEGELPDGIGLTSYGLFAGRTEVAGEYSFRVAASSDYGTTYADYTIVVNPGPTYGIDLSASATTVPQGGSITFSVRGRDAYGNPTGDLTDDVTLTSDVTTDVIVGETVTFPHASPHTLTAEYDQMIAQLVIEVVPAASGGGGAGPTADDAIASTGADDGLALVAVAAVAVLGLGVALVIRRRSLRG